MGDDRIAFNSPPTGEYDWSEAEFLRSLSWRKSADAKLVRAARDADVAGFCRRVRRTLIQRRAAGLQQKATGNRSCRRILQPLWSQFAWDDSATAGYLSELLGDLQRRIEKRANEPAKPSPGVAKRVAACLELAPPQTSPWAHVAWLRVLIETASLLDDENLLQLWQRLLVGSIPLVDIPSTTADASGAEFGDDRQLLIAGELPWLAGLTFADVKGAVKVRRAGQAELRWQLEAVTDGDGTPHALALERLPLTLAVLTRSLSAAEEFTERLFNDAASDRFSQLVDRAAAMTFSDGRLAFSNGASFAPASLLRTASRLSNAGAKDPASRRLLRLTDDMPLGGRSGRKTRRTKLPKLKRQAAAKSKSRPSSQSDWAEVACLRNNWIAGGDSCILAHHDRYPQLSVSAFERLLISGEWKLEVNVDETAVEIQADWECVCWHSDDDADYVELQQTASGDVVLSRQVLLSRTDHFLMLADSVVSGQGSTLDVESRLSLAPDVAVEEDRTTREVALKGETIKARLFPLGLDQARVEKPRGSVSVGEGELSVRQSSIGGGLHLPIVIDWSPDRRRSPAQWRGLTVAEDGRRLPPEVACGQRLRVGKHQWLFYRSLRPGETGRTVLGHHTLHETVIGEFTGLGEVAPIVLVETS